MVVAFGVLLLLFISVSLILGLFGLLFILGGGVWVYESAPKCPSCGWPWTLKKVSTEVVGQQRGMGLVTRVETHVGRVGDQSTSNVVRRQERAPVVSSTVRINLVCSHCHKSAFKQFVETREDFSPPAARPPVLVREIHREVQKEVLKVPCRFCKTLVDPIRQQKCPNCGAPFAT